MTHLDPILDRAQVLQREAAQARLQTLMTDPERVYVLAIATTGLKKAHPVAVSVLDGHGDHVYGTLIHTEAVIEPKTQTVHGIRQGDLQGQPTLRQVLPLLELYLGGANVPVVTFTPKFVIDALVNGARAEGCELFGMGHWLSGQELLTPILGTYNWTRGAWKPLSLPDAIGERAVSERFLPIGTPLGNAQRLAWLLREHGQSVAPVGT